MSKVALVTGITGQDGSYLAELLLSKGYEVYGLVRRLGIPNTIHINHILDKITLIEGDLTDQTSLNSAMVSIQPDEIYNLAAQSFVGTSWTQSILTAEVTGLGAVRVYNAMKHHCQHARLYQASSSEMFGGVQETPQTENTAFYPRSPYGCAKLYAHWMAINYRERYDMHISNGIMFNHDSARRGIEFVTRKISDGVARIHLGLTDKLILGNLESKRDWGFSGDYIKGMWLMLQQEDPGDYVFSTGESHSIEEFCDAAFNHVGLCWEQYVKTDVKYIRPAEVNILRGDSRKAKDILGWQSEVTFNELIRMMVDADIERLTQKL